MSFKRWWVFPWALLSCLLVLVSPNQVRGQRHDEPGPFAWGVSLGRHGLGTVIEVGPIARVALSFEAEGLNFGGLVTAGFGPSLDLYQEDTGRVFARVLYGAVKCNNPVGGSGGCSFGNEARRSVSPGLGLELRLSPDGMVWAGMVIGYWHPALRDGLGRDLQHFSFAAVLRFRP